VIWCRCRNPPICCTLNAGRRSWGTPKSRGSFLAPRPTAGISRCGQPAALIKPNLSLSCFSCWGYGILNRFQIVDRPSASVRAIPARSARNRFSMPLAMILGSTPIGLPTGDRSALICSATKRRAATERRPARPSCPDQAVERSPDAGHLLQFQRYESGVFLCPAERAQAQQVWIVPVGQCECGSKSVAFFAVTGKGGPKFAMLSTPERKCIGAPE